MANIARALGFMQGIERWPFVAALRMQFRVIGALMMREAMTRFGRENIGFFWLMGEPLILTVGIMIIWSIAGLTKGHNVDVISFALTGYTVLTLWRHITGRAVHCFSQNSGLLFHRNIHFLDTLISRTLLETTGTGIAFFIAYIPLYLLDLIDPINDPLLLVAAWLILAWFSFGVGLIIAALTEMSHVVEHFVQPFMYLTLPVTGTFFMVEWLPQNYQALVVYSPLVNINEMFRDGLFGDKIETHWYISYTIIWCIALTAIGLFFANRARERIQF